MLKISKYTSPLGRMTMAGNEEGLVGLWFDGQKFFPKEKLEGGVLGENSVIVETKKYLDAYFSGATSMFSLPLVIETTPFRKEVWEMLRTIPYGETRSYQAIAKEVARKMGRDTMSAQAIGGAVGKNPFTIVIPCHRVIGKDGSLIGYAGGVDKKRYLLELEASYCGGNREHLRPL